MRAMENLPLSNYRNYQSLINLVPGATPARFQNAVTDTPGRATTNVNGQERAPTTPAWTGRRTSWSRCRITRCTSAGGEHPGSQHRHEQLRCRAGMTGAPRSR